MKKVCTFLAILLAFVSLFSYFVSDFEFEAIYFILLALFVLVVPDYLEDSLGV